MPRYPASVIIDTVHACNARCPFCPLFTGSSTIDRTGRESIMPAGLFEKIIAEIAAWETPPANISMANNGETLLDPAIAGKLSILDKYKLARSTKILTNGYFLDEENSRAILSSGIREIIIGFDGATKEIYEAHRVRCNYERTLENIRNFVRIRSETGAKTRVNLKYVRTRDNEHEVLDAYSLFAGILDPALDVFEDSLAMDWGDETASHYQGFYFNKVAKGKKQDHCHLADNFLVVHPDGVLAACCWDYNLGVSNGGFGNAHHEDMIDVWRGDRRQAFIDSLHGDRQPPDKCRNCIWIHELPRLPESLLKLDPDNLIHHGQTSALYRIARP